jgi:hypothetical protein
MYVYVCICEDEVFGVFKTKRKAFLEFSRWVQAECDCDFDIEEIEDFLDNDVDFHTESRYGTEIAIEKHYLFE